MPSRVDSNQAQIVAELRQMGCAVQSLASVRDGCPDLLVSFRGCNYLFEVKDPKQPPSKRQLTKLEKKWHEEWRGQVHVIHNTKEALAVILKQDKQKEIISEVI